MPYKNITLSDSAKSEAGLSELTVGGTVGFIRLVTQVNVVNIVLETML